MVVIFSTICQAQTITIAADPWPPYNGIAGSAEPGYGIELAKKIYGEAGYEIIYINIPWARAVPETRQGNFNAIIGANIEDAPDFIFPEEEFGISKRALWALKGTAWRFNGMDSLKSVKIGAIQDYSYGKQFNDFFRKNKNLVDYVHGENALLLNISKLLTGRINVIIENRNVFLYTVKKLGVSDRIINVGSEVSSDKVYIAFSPGIKESKKYAAIFTRGIRKMQQNGDLKKILEKYGLEYWK
jgi:polar amino acid transport system substrate-binding protein